MKKTANPKPASRRARTSPPRPKVAAPSIMVLPAILDMRSAREFKRLLEARFENRRPCVIDASKVATISTGCVQILVAFARSMSARAAPVKLLRPSASVLQSVHSLGLTSALATCVLED
ncbi:MAG: STAS domain-containing protein [Hyphomicrobium sp.]